MPDPDDTAPALPCVNALMAATLALMSTLATREPRGAAPHTTDTLIARKIVSNLFFLQAHPALAAPMRPVLARLHAAWLPLARAGAAEGVPAPRVGQALH